LKLIIFKALQLAAFTVKETNFIIARTLLSDEQLLTKEFPSFQRYLHWATDFIEPLLGILSAFCGSTTKEE
jgi:hypothetical protein